MRIIFFCSMQGSWGITTSEGLLLYISAEACACWGSIVRTSTELGGLRGTIIGITASRCSAPGFWGCWELWPFMASWFYEFPAFFSRIWPHGMIRVTKRTIPADINITRKTCTQLPHRVTGHALGAEPGAQAFFASILSRPQRHVDRHLFQTIDKKKADSSYAGLTCLHFFLCRSLRLPFMLTTSSVHVCEHWMAPGWLSSSAALSDLRGKTPGAPFFPPEAGTSEFCVW